MRQLVKSQGEEDDVSVANLLKLLYFLPQMGIENMMRKKFTFKIK